MIKTLQSTELILIHIHPRVFPVPPTSFRELKKLTQWLKKAHSDCLWKTLLLEKSPL